MKSTVQTTIRNVPSFIRIIAIKDSFRESRPKNYKTVTSDVLYDSSLKSLNLKTTVYEVLKHTDTIKFFMDIEGIPETEEGLIFVIIDSFKKYSFKWYWNAIIKCDGKLFKIHRVPRYPFGSFCL